jgi:uncharacterized protein (DUF1684 family)
VTSSSDAPSTAHPSDFERDWNSWHASRLQELTAPHGSASLVATHWLSTEPQSLEGLDGRWRLDGAAIVGDSFTIEEGGEVMVGSRVLRHFRRDDDVALRVLDPDAPSRASLVAVDAYPPDGAWVLTGRFEPAAQDAVIDVDEIDGYTESTALAGTVTVELDGEEVALIVTGPHTDMQLVFTDPTSGSETYRFRFLDLSADAGAGPIEVDFNRAHLPPCSVSDHYVCPLPPAQNRLAVPVRAGEKQIVRG